MLLEGVLLIRNVIFVSLIRINHIKSLNSCPESSFIGSILALLADLVVGLVVWILLVYANVVEVHKGIRK